MVMVNGEDRQKSEVGEWNELKKTMVIIEII